MKLTYPYNLFDLKGKITIVTGGMGKLGTEFTDALTKANSKVAIFDIIDKPNPKLAWLAKKYPLMFLKVDITKENEVKAGLKKIEQKWGTPTILVNNAGWKASPNDPRGAGKPFEEYPVDLWDNVFKLNTTAAMICSKIVGGNMVRKKKPGVIINIASHFALVAPDQRVYDYRKKLGKTRFVKDASYSASKAALLALTRDLASQWARYNIRVVALAPGGVFNPKSDKEFVKNYSSRVPLGRMAAMDEYNGAIIFLASDAASYMTGSVLVIDGGWTAW